MPPHAPPQAPKASGGLFIPQRLQLERWAKLWLEHEWQVQSPSFIGGFVLGAITAAQQPACMSGMPAGDAPHLLHEVRLAKLWFEH